MRHFLGRRVMFFHNLFFVDNLDIYNRYIFTISVKLLTGCLNYSQSKRNKTHSSEVINKPDKLFTKRYKSLTKSRLRLLISMFVKQKIFRSGFAFFKEKLACFAEVYVTRWYQSDGSIASGTRRCGAFIIRHFGKAGLQVFQEE
jgi:hypothetical protein